MVRIKTSDELILNAVDFYRRARPNLDTKPGTVARDIVIDGPNTQLARVYDELAQIRTANSFRNSFGQDLDRLAANFGATRNQGSFASGFAVLTFNSIDADIPISPGDTVSANNGATFTINSGITVSVTALAQYKATAQKLRADLDFVGITDEYAIEVAVTSTAVGQRGNISKYALNSTSVAGVSNVTNAVSFGGGAGVESDEQFKNRVLAIFSGAQTGTAAGYEQAILKDPAARDVQIIQPGDSFMTRDGTQVFVAEDGTRTIIKDGTGGKVDVYVQGLRISEILDSYIYRDKSGQNDPTNSKNDFVLGQIDGDENKTVTTKRLENLQNGTLPDQPVNDLIAVSGTSSGSNFVEKTVDSLGRVSGNYELIRDTGVYGGSPFGFDRLHWISNQITGFSEEITKGQFNGQDSVSFTDTLLISGATQNIQITNENSKVDPSNRSIIQLYHYPVSNVSRVFNVNTGERYVITSQNLDGTGRINSTGRISISGGTLPATSDTLQVDYTWVYSYDNDIDFDNIANSQNPRVVTDSVDWGYSNSVTREGSIVAGSLLTVTVTHPISSVISVNTYVSNVTTVTSISDRLAVVLPVVVENVVSIRKTSDGAEVFDTKMNNGTISSLTIFLPTDTVAEVGDVVEVIYNAENVFFVDNVSGTFSGNVITLPAGSTTAGTLVEVNYIADIKTLVPATQLSSLPIQRYPVASYGNSFKTLTSTDIGTQPFTNLYSGLTIVSNLRKAPSRLQLSISGTISPGVLTVAGSTFSKGVQIVVPVTGSGLTQNISSAIKTVLGLNSAQSIPSTVSIARIVSVNRVDVASSLQVLSVINSYDINGYSIKNNQYDVSLAVTNANLSNTEFTLPNTVNNSDNSPQLGDYLQITFYIVNSSDYENISFSQSGTLYTQKVFANIYSIGKSSGFISAASNQATLSVSNINQPINGNRYFVTYDYLAPKANERINITYNKNQLITDSTFNIEQVRPIGMDVIVKAAVAIFVDSDIFIVLSEGFQNSAAIVKQNVKDAIVTFLNANTLGSIVDQSDIINVAYTVAGVDRVRIEYFNRADVAGSVLSISTQKNEYIQAGTINVNTETR
jgi:hypothetical protein